LGLGLLFFVVLANLCVVPEELLELPEAEGFDRKEAIDLCFL
jgi:hypothetical protein